ncbi:apoptotic chromatin condensation inducer in the nucleus isoform X2 [Acipenser ruthenus]|uniref:apoptotic chromatin condensation inducer in the nucleus isoform X2 n=1 Tax=Acipenser ruthenus TaxID=7906 RepID=UPI0027414825|nr:apoptotic chromatin condensation inducer in the nucleus isoform X2 [Acipenser ruthenus]
MAELEDVTLDGKPLHSLRVADLKTALEQRGLPKSGQKNALVKRLKGALMLENLQKHSTPHSGLQPNSQIGEEMSQNSFIKQYLAKQQELLRQRLEREAREAAEAEETDSPSVQEEESLQEDKSEGYDSGSCQADQEESLTASLPKCRAVPARSSSSPQSRRRSSTRTVRQSPARPQPAELDSENLPGPVTGTAYSPVPELQNAEPARSRRSRHSRDGSSLDPSSSPVPDRTADGAEQSPRESKARRSSSRQSKDSLAAPSAVLVVTPSPPAQQTGPTDLVVRAEAQSPGPRAVASLSVRVIGGSTQISGSSVVVPPGVSGGVDGEVRGASPTRINPQQQESSEMGKDVMLTEGFGSVGVEVVGGGEEKAAPKERLQRSRQLREHSPPPPNHPNPVLKCGVESFPLPDTPKQSPPASDEQAPEVGRSQMPQKTKKEREGGGGSSFEATKRQSHHQEPGPLSRLAKAMEDDDDDCDEDEEGEDKERDKELNLTLEKRKSMPEVVAVGSMQGSILMHTSVEKANAKLELSADSSLTLAKAEEDPEAPRGRPREVLGKGEISETGFTETLEKSKAKESSGTPQKVVEAQKTLEVLGKPAEVSKPVASEVLELGQTNRSTERKDGELPEKTKLISITSREGHWKSSPAAFRAVGGSVPLRVEPKPALEMSKEVNPVTDNKPVQVSTAAPVEKTVAETIVSVTKHRETEKNEKAEVVLIHYSSSASAEQAAQIDKPEEGAPEKIAKQAAGEKTLETDKPKDPKEVFAANTTDKQEQDMPAFEPKEVSKQSSQTSEKGAVEQPKEVPAVPENLPFNMKRQTAVPQKDTATPKQDPNKSAASEEAKAAVKVTLKEVLQPGKTEGVHILKLDSRRVLQPEKGVGEMTKVREQPSAIQSHLPLSKRGRDLGTLDKKQEETDTKTPATKKESSLKSAHPEKPAGGDSSKISQTPVKEVPALHKPTQETSRFSENLTVGSPAPEPKSVEVTAEVLSQKQNETSVIPTQTPLTPQVQSSPKKFRVFRDTSPSPEARAPPKKTRVFRDGLPALDHPKKSFQTQGSAERSIPEPKPEKAPLVEQETEKPASLEQASETGQLPKLSGYATSREEGPRDATWKEGELSTTAEVSPSDPKPGSESVSLKRIGPPAPVEKEGPKPEEQNSHAGSKEPENEPPKKARGVFPETEKESGPPKRKASESSILDKDPPKPAQEAAETSSRQQTHKEMPEKQEDKTPVVASGKLAETAKSTTSEMPRKPEEKPRAETPKSSEGRLMKAVKELETEPMGPILPPSPPPEETESGHPPTPPLSAPDTDRERGRRSREGASPSSSSSSSSSSNSSSSASSSRSSSSSRSRSPSSDRRSVSPQRDSLSRDSGAFCQPEGSPDSGRPDDPPASRQHERRKRRAEREEEEGEHEERAGTSHSKKPCLTAEGRGNADGAEKKEWRRTGEGESRGKHTASELKQDHASAMMESERRAEAEVSADSQSESCSEHRDERGNKGRAEEGVQPKTFTSRKISVLSASKFLPAVSTAEPAGGSAAAAVPGGGAGGGEADGNQIGRKRRWGSSTAGTAKKPSISITTESLKSLIPDMKPMSVVGQEAVLDLHPDEGRLSGEENERGDGREEPGQQDRALKICRTVTQVVPVEAQENGQKETHKEGGKEDAGCEEEERKEPQSVTMETQLPVTGETDVKKATPSGTLVRRSINQQKSGMSVTIDDPVRTAQHPSPPRGKTTNIVHISNLVRPFTLGQLKELLNRTGTLVDEGFWIDKIKSHCYVTYSMTEEAVATRNALHGVKWPQSNPKFLSVEFSEQDELNFHKGLLADLRPAEGPRQSDISLHRSSHTVPPSSGPPQTHPSDRAVRDQWAEREREMERRERTRAEREWDRDKVRDYNSKHHGGSRGPHAGPEGPGGVGRRSRSRSRDRRRKERAKSKEKATDRKEKAPEEPPAKLLDDLFCKTKAAPCIYWLPLTDKQVVLKEGERAERMKERIKRRKEQEEEEKRRDEERRERLKEREKEVAERVRVRELEKKREQRRGGGERGGGRGGSNKGTRSRSQSTPPPRDRRH